MTDPRAQQVLASVSRVAILEVLGEAKGPMGDPRQRNYRLARLRPFVTPRLCVAELVPRPS
jgi:hypothetical protein